MSVGGTGQCVYDVGYSAQQFAFADNSLSGARSPGAFNYIRESLVVPEGPSTPSDNGNLLLWFGASNSSGDLVQPELWWNLTANQWTMFAQFTDPESGGYISGTSYGVNVGDTLTGEAWIWQGNVSGDGYYWSVAIGDAESGNISVISMGVAPNPNGTGSGNPYLTKAFGAVMEVHGLIACDGLPSAGYQVFDLLNLTQMASGTSGWETEIDATGALWSSGAWSPNAHQPPGPACAYNGYEFARVGGGYGSEIYWNTTP